MKRSEVLFLGLVLVAVFIIVYSPHFNYPFPYHIDEWHQITKSMNIGNEVRGIESNFEIGLHFLLFCLSKLTNLVLVYKFLPALWAVLSALTLFFVVYKKTGKNFLIALFSVIFFASLKSNVNILGLWFFTPLTFAIPFIFLYIYFFTEGMEKQNKKLVLISLGIMVFLIPFHALSVTFSIPILAFYCLFHLKYIKKEYKFFSLFLIVPLIGIIFYKFVMRKTFLEVLSNLTDLFIFKRGWGILEIQNSFFEVYSFIGYLLVALGVMLILLHRTDSKKYLVYILWPVITLVSIISFRIFGISLFAPYQRNLYYFALSLPFLSAFGLYFIIKIVKNEINNININHYQKEIVKKSVILIIILLLLFFTFRSYYKIPENSSLYQVITEKDYEDLLYLKGLPNEGEVMADIMISTALYPISHKNEVSALFFSIRNRKDVERFFNSNGCEVKNRIIKKQNVSYILSKEPINCNWQLLRSENNYIYQT